jgi:hypothetical protein
MEISIILQTGGKSTKESTNIFAPDKLRVATLDLYSLQSLVPEATFHKLEISI